MSSSNSNQNKNSDPAEGRVHQQQNPDGTVSNYDDTGDKVKKGNDNRWVKDTLGDTSNTSPSSQKPEEKEKK